MKGNLCVSLLNVENEKRQIVTDKLINNKVTCVHYDVMDGIFVPNKAITLEEIKQNITKSKKHFVDIHLMVSAPEL
jgi:ribulose-phosphate 3-epimerase